MGGMSEPPLVTYEVDDRIAVITLDSPANRNALSRRLVAELTAALDSCAADDRLHGVLLRSSQPVFCAGADLREAATVDMRVSAASIVALQRAIVACPVPVVIRLDGPVRAGGLGLVASADIVVCRDEVTFALTEVRLGLAAASISIALKHRLTARAASDWFLTGRQFTADEALTGGLVTQLASAQSMDAQVAAVLADLRSGIRQGLVQAKALLTGELLATFDEQGAAMAELSGRLFHSTAAQSAMAAALRAR